MNYPRTRTFAYPLALLALTTSCSETGNKTKPTNTEQPATTTGHDAALEDSGTPTPSCGPDGPVDGEYPIPLSAGLAPVPPMGWNSWNRFGCNTSAEQIKSMADAMVESGMKAAGYQYINIDDCWHEAERDADGQLVASDKFPDGIKDVADYVHSKDLKLGIYSDRGLTTCARRAGSRGHVEDDAKLFAQWGVDYLKYDNCDYIDGSNDHNLDEALMTEEFTQMSDALQTSGRDMVFSISAWKFYEWSVPISHLWRTTSDITDDWASISNNIRINNTTAAYAGPNHWNDPDMLEVGNGGMTEAEYQAHFGMWAIMAAPLLAGNDLANMVSKDDRETIDILTNEEVIAVDQDAWGIQGVSVWDSEDLSVWSKPLSAYGTRAVALLNQGDSSGEITVRFSDLGLAKGKATLRDLWAKQDLGEHSDSYTAQVPKHAMLMLKVVGNEAPLPCGNVYLSDLPWIHAANGRGPAERDQSNGSVSQGDGEPISIGGKSFNKGLGVGYGSQVIFRLGKSCSRFKASAGVDDQANGQGSVVMQVWADGDKLFDSGVLTGADSAVDVDVDVSDKYRLELKVTNALDGTAYDYASWGDARLECEE